MEKDINRRMIRETPIIHFLNRLWRKPLFDEWTFTLFLFLFSFSIFIGKLFIIGEILDIIFRFESY